MDLDQASSSLKFQAELKLDYRVEPVEIDFTGKA